MPVRARFTGDGLNGYLMESFSVEPKNWRSPDRAPRGPYHEVLTDQIDLSNVTGTSEFHVMYSWTTRSSALRLPRSRGYGDDEEAIAEETVWLKTCSERMEFAAWRRSPVGPGDGVRLGVALGKDAATHAPHPEILIGADTRESGTWISELVAGGLASQGRGCGTPG